MSERLPQSSEPAYVRVMISGSPEQPEPPLSVTFGEIIRSSSQLSSRPASSGAGTSSMHSTMTSAGTPVTSGAIVSLISIVCVTSVKFPQPSLARYVRVIVSGQLLPSLASSSCVIVTSPQVSVAVTSEMSEAGTSSVHCTLIPAGLLVITGAVVSTTVITWAQLALLPQASMAVHVRVITLSSAQLPADTALA